MYSQSVPALISKNVGNTLSNYKVWGNGVIINVMDTAYGAKGDGIADDTAAIVAAITACPAGGTVFFPTPSVKYRCTQTIEITKPIKLMGFNKVYEIEGGLEKANIIEFASGVLKGIHVTSYAVTIENLVIKMLDISASVIAGIDLDSSIGGGMRYTRLSNVYVYMNNIYGAGIRGQNLIVSSFEKCECFQGKYGFYLYTTGTSVKFDNCWARAQCAGGAGYYLNNYTYISFVGTACDSVNNPDYGYQLIGCRGISFNGVGSELMGKTMFRLDNCNGITIDGSFAYNMNQLTTAVATFAELTGGTKNVIFTGCVDTTTGVLPNVRTDATSLYPIIQNCDFAKGYSENGSIAPPPTINQGYFQIGKTIIAENPSGTSLAVVMNRGLMTKGLKIGVIKSDLSGFLGYFDDDGSLINNLVSELPTANVANKGKTLVLMGNGTTTADTLQICLMSSTGTYSWKVIATG